MTDLYRVEWHFLCVTWTPLLHYKYNTGGISSSGMRRCVIGWMVSDYLKHHGGFIFKSQAILWAVLLGLLCRWRCRCYSPLKCQDPFTQWHSITSWKTWILSHTIVKISNFTAVTCILWKIGIHAERPSLLQGTSQLPYILLLLWCNGIQWLPKAVWFRCWP